MILLCCMLFKVNAQAVGEWTTYYSYSSVTQVIETSDKIYAVASGSLFSCDKDGNVNQQYTKLTGLSDQNISQIAYNADLKAILLTYSNGNIDLIIDNIIYNIPDFKDKTMSGDKTIYYIHFDGDYAYLATGVGVLNVNVKKQEIYETYKIKKDGVDLPVYGVTTIGDFIYASTKSGIFMGNKTDNLIDYNNWTQISSEVGQQIVSFKDELYLLVASNGLYKYEGSNFTRIINDGQINNLIISNGRMLVNAKSKLYSYESASTRDDIALSGITTAVASVYSGSQSYWVAAGEKGLLKIENGAIDKSEIKPEGPDVNSVYKQIVMHDRLYCVGGDQRPSLINSKVMIYDLQTLSWKILPNAIPNVNNMVVHPTNPNLFYVTSCSVGLCKFENDVLTAQYTLSNPETGLEGADDGPAWTWVSSPAFDENLNLWMGNAQCTYGIKIFNPTNNTWEKKSFKDTKEFRELYIASDKKKWFLGTTGGWGRFVFVLDDTNDVRYVSFKDQDGNALDAETYHSIAEDKQNSIWIGTNRGIATIPNPSKIFDADFYCTRIKIPRNDGSGLADYLLDSEQINAIIVDGGNRKWLGTEGSGLYLVSSDGLQTIEHFTTDNSPLPSNVIRSLSITPDGLLFVGTDSGLLSYKTTASDGKIDYSNVYAYPNPVRPEYTGLVTITGLIENSTIKITDISGNLIYEGISQGGQLSWNGKNQSGDRPATGVYLVFCTTSNGDESIVTKIMMIK